MLHGIFTVVAILVCVPGCRVHGIGYDEEAALPKACREVQRPNVAQQAVHVREARPRVLLRRLGERGRHARNLLPKSECFIVDRPTFAGSGGRSYRARALVGLIQYCRPSRKKTDFKKPSLEVRNL